MPPIELKEISPSLDVETLTENIMEEAMLNKLHHSVYTLTLRFPILKHEIGSIHVDHLEEMNAEELAKVFRIDLTSATGMLKTINQGLKQTRHPSFHC